MRPGGAGRTRPARCGQRRALPLALVMAAALSGCDGLLVDPAGTPPDYGTLALAIAPAAAAAQNQASAGDGHRLRVQLRRGVTITLDTLLLFGLDQGVRELVLPVALSATPATLFVDVELRENRLALLRGGREVVLNRRQVTVAEIELFPADDRSLAAVSGISAGIFHSCAPRTDGQAFCWGDNLYGQLGDGGTGARLTPATVTGGVRFREVTAAFATSCGLDLEGRIHCWGESNRGALGAGTIERSPTPIPIQTGERFASMTLGGLHGCGLTDDGRAICWGYNRYGQVGNGRAATHEAVPVPVAPSLRFRELSAGYLHTCGITLQGRAYCWGYNEYGQLGTGAEAEFVPLPAPVGTAADEFVAISAGGLHTCALRAAGEAYCWGYNAFGQLGDGGEQDSASPRAVAGAARFRTISAGGGHSCGLAQQGDQAYCWGHNRSGPLGTGGIVGAREPAAVAGGFAMLRIDAGLHHTCAVTAAAESLCWGFNRFGQLGDRSTISSPTPGYVFHEDTGSFALASRQPQYPAALWPLFEAHR